MDYKSLWTRLQALLEKEIDSQKKFWTHWESKSQTGEDFKARMQGMIYADECKTLMEAYHKILEKMNELESEE